MQTNIKLNIVSFLFVFISSLTQTVHLQAQEEKFVVVLDAGHGGDDAGNIGNGYREKNIALKVALEVGQALEQYPNIEVIYTRTKDVFIELYKRADIANKADADLFISIHCNSVGNPNPYGTETWVLGERNTEKNFEVAKRENEVIFLEDNYKENYAGFDPNSPESTIAIGIEQEVYVEQSIILARKIEDAFKTKAKRKSRGLKQESLLVIRNTYMPSVLVELGFLTNNAEGRFLNSVKGQTIMASALSDAILEYKKELEQNIGRKIISDNISSDGSGKNTEALIFNDVIFKVQIAASSKNLEPKPYNFKGLSQISKDKTGELYKYYYGNTSDYNEIKEMQLQAVDKGYTSSFVVAFKNGEPVSVSNLLDGVSNK